MKSTLKDMNLENYKMKIANFKCNQKFLKAKTKHFKLGMNLQKLYSKKQEKKS